ncbi:hypothetical protein [Burkholderia cepacia]|uniref:hypothetical protein n=1 Tax=Burkholderia cepacia TaxID=292 RepID=UPI001589A91F|nr:hypothetical protein [Burkholderia cepacia]
MERDWRALPGQNRLQLATNPERFRWCTPATQSNFRISLIAFTECFGCRCRADLFRRGRWKRNESHGGRAERRPAAHERQSRARLHITERMAPASLWAIRIADSDAAAQVRRTAEQKEIDRLAIGSKRVAAWGREHDNEKQARSMQKRVDKLKKDRTVAAMSGGERARLPFPARSTASDHPR